MATIRIDDRSSLSADANAAIDARLEPDERMLVIVRGMNDSAMVATDRRVFVWQDNLTGHHYRDLSGIDGSIGIPSWAALRGPGILDRNPKFGSREDYGVLLQDAGEGEYAIPLVRALITAAHAQADGPQSADAIPWSVAEHILFGAASELPRALSERLLAELASGELVRVVIRGEGGSFMIGTERRALVWKKNQLAAWPYSDLTGVEWNFGWNRWVVLRGPTLKAGEPRFDSTFAVVPQKDAETVHRAPELARLVATSAANQGLGVPPVPALPAAVASRDTPTPETAEEAGVDGETIASADGTLPSVDRRHIPTEAESQVASRLATDEPIAVIIRGRRSSALIGTDRQVMVWKDRKLASWPSSALSGVESDFGWRLPWIALRGPGLDPGIPTSTSMAGFRSAIEVTSVREATAALPFLIGLIAAESEHAGFDVVATRRQREQSDARLAAFDKVTDGCYACGASLNAGKAIADARETLRRTQRDEATAERCWRTYWNLLALVYARGRGAEAADVAALTGDDVGATAVAINLLIDIRLGSRQPTGHGAGFLCLRCQALLPIDEAQSQTGSRDDSVRGFGIESPRLLPTFSDVGGMASVKDDVRRSVGLVIRDPTAASQLGITFNGILMHGPPGTGKTHLAKAIAGEFGCRFLHLEVSQLVSAYQGQSANRVADAFAVARERAPSVLFFDEFDAIAQRRDAAPASGDATQVLTQLLRSLEAIRDRPDVIVLAATNDLNSLDPAISRPGRFDRAIRIDLPDHESRREIIRVLLRSRPTAEDMDLEDLAAQTGGQSAAGLERLVNEAALHVLAERNAGHIERVITHADLSAAVKASGAQDRPLVGDWSWDELILADSAKRELMELQRLIEDPQRAVRLGIQPPRGALLYGPPGTGKTTIAKVLASQARTSFYPVRGSELISKWMGEGEQNVARLWERARANAPSIIFFDEIDAVAPRRASAVEAGGATQAMNRIVNQLLQEIDGLSSDGGVFVLGATNRPEMVDEAMLRGGRLARQVLIPLPDQAGRLALLQLFTRGMRLAADVDVFALADHTAGASGADLQALCQQAGIHALMGGASDDVSAVTMADFEAALAVAPRRTSPEPDADLGLCDWHGDDAPEGCERPATAEMGRRQYCALHAPLAAARLNGLG